MQSSPAHSNDRLCAKQSNESIDSTRTNTQLHRNREFISQFGICLHFFLVFFVRFRMKWKRVHFRMSGLTDSTSEKFTHTRVGPYTNPHWEAFDARTRVCVCIRVFRAFRCWHLFQRWMDSRLRLSLFTWTHDVWQNVRVSCCLSYISVLFDSIGFWTAGKLLATNSNRIDQNCIGGRNSFVCRAVGGSVLDLFGAPVCACVCRYVFCMCGRRRRAYAINLNVCHRNQLLQCVVIFRCFFAIASAVTHSFCRSRRAISSTKTFLHFIHFGCSTRFLPCPCYCSLVYYRKLVRNILGPHAHPRHTAAAVVAIRSICGIG